MLVKHHILAGLIFCGIIFLIFPKINLIGLSLIFLSSIFIDTDHYVYYVYKKKDWSLKRSVNYFYGIMQRFLSMDKEGRKRFYGGIFFFHNIEFLILILLLGMFFTSYFYFILIGLTFHMFLDAIFEYGYTKSFYKHSLIYSLTKFKGKELI
jgi:hypothetical protein